MVARLLRRRGLATFALLVLAAEVAGRSLTARVDRLLHVAPLANSGADYYPAALVCIKIAAAVGLAALLARLVRARGAAEAGERLLTTLGHRHHRPSPQLQQRLEFRVWLAAFAGTSLVYLVQGDAEGIAAGRWPLLAPWLHTYALPVFALLAVAIAFAWRIARWVDDVEDYAARTLARVRRILTGFGVPVAAHGRPTDDAAPRRRFGLAFESRPPPLPA
jgi:hypothetical protein